MSRNCRRFGKLGLALAIACKAGATELATNDACCGPTNSIPAMQLTRPLPASTVRMIERLEDVTTAGGFGHLQKGHGVGFADLDNDGNQDIYEVMGGAFEGDTAYNVLYLNPGSTNHWLKLKLEGTKANRVAMGARIHVTVQTPSGSRDIYRTVSSGGSFGSSPLRQEIGLGDATAISSVEIRWPGSGTHQVLTGLERDHAYAVREGDAQASMINLKRIPSISPTHPIIRT
jgi:hypothetical protein